MLGGIGFVVLACACFAVLDTTAKYVVLTVPVLMAAWVRYLLQALLSTAVLLPLHGAQVLRTAKPRLQLLRGLLLMSSSLLAFTGLRYMPVGEFTAIVMVTPLGVTLLAATLLKEKIAPLHWVFVAGGFLGVLAIVRPGSQALGWGHCWQSAASSPTRCSSCSAATLARPKKPRRPTSIRPGWVPWRCHCCCRSPGPKWNR